MAMRSGEIPEAFSAFVEACGETLCFLIDDHGFQHLGPKVVAYECSVGFIKKPNVAIRVFYEPGSTPWLTVAARLDPASGESIQESLVVLAAQRRGDWTPPRLKERDDPTREDLAQVLEQYAALLRESFPDVLEAADGIGTRLRDGC